jgi:DNA polymerase III subunit alpha
MSACLRGDIPKSILAESTTKTPPPRLHLRDIFGKNNFFLEIQDHHLDQDKRLTAGQPALAGDRPAAGGHQRFALPAPRRRPRARNPAVHPDRQDHERPQPHALEHAGFLPEIARDEMMELFGELEDAVDRTWEIAQRCHVKLEKVKEPFPKFDVPPSTPPTPTSNTSSRARVSKAPAAAGSSARQGMPEARSAGVHRAPGPRNQMIQQMKFSGYFLIVWDFIRYAKSKRAFRSARAAARRRAAWWATPWRSPISIRCSTACCSSASSIPSASAMPDIDIDFCMNRRGEVIQYVTEKYGREQVAQIITFNTLARAPPSKTWAACST